MYSLYIYIYLIHIPLSYVYERFSIRDWLTWLWRLTSPKSCIQLESQESWWFSFSLKASWLKTQKSLCFNSSLKAGTLTSPFDDCEAQSRISVSLRLLFCLGRYLIRWGPPTLGGICFTQATDSNANLVQKHPQRNGQISVWLNIWSLCGSVKLACKVNHYTPPAHFYF